MQQDALPVESSHRDYHSIPGQILLPGVIREQLHLQAGDDFEVTIEDEDTITLRRVSHPANRGLVDLLLACPGPFEIPVREIDDTAPLSF